MSLKIGQLVRINFQFRSLKDQSSAAFMNKAGRWVDLDNQQVGLICASSKGPRSKRTVLFGDQLFTMWRDALEPVDV